MTTPKAHVGKLRPQFYLHDDKIIVEWCTPERRVVWTEAIAIREGHKMASQIECDGTFVATAGFYVDTDGNRHFVMAAEPGKLGLALG